MGIKNDAEDLTVDEQLEIMRIILDLLEKGEIDES